MVYRKPPVLTRRVINPVLCRLRPRGVETLTVTGRRSGRPRRVPVIPVEVEGRRYLVAPYGESEWVRNVRACGEGTLDGPHGHVRFEARELPPDARPAVIAAYRRQTGRTVERLFRDLPDPASHPVFALEETTLAD